MDETISPTWRRPGRRPVRARAGACPLCGKPTGNLGTHTPACARRNTPAAPAVSPLGYMELELVARAGAHAWPAEKLPEEARAWAHVTDLDLARLIHFIERGGKVYPSPTGRTWYADGLPRFPSHQSTVTRTVNEGLRLGLVRQLTLSTSPGFYLTKLAAAPVHARSARNLLRPACGIYDRDVLRWRLLGREQADCVDCSACLLMPVSCIAVST